MVAKRQRKVKAWENGTKENLRTRVRPSGDTNTRPSWLAQFAQGRLSREETNRVKRRSQDRLRPLLWGRLALTPRGYTIQGYGLPVVMYGCKSWTIKKAEC